MMTRVSRRPTAAKTQLPGSLVTNSARVAPPVSRSFLFLSGTRLSWTNDPLRAMFCPSDTAYCTPTRGLPKPMLSVESAPAKSCCDGCIPCADSLCTLPMSREVDTLICAFHATGAVSVCAQGRQEYRSAPQPIQRGTFLPISPRCGRFPQQSTTSDVWLSTGIK